MKTDNTQPGPGRVIPFGVEALSQNPKIKGNTISVFYAGDDKDAKAAVAALISKMGFDAVDAGALTAARTLEPLALLNIALGYGLGNGTSIGFSFNR